MSLVIAFIVSGFVLLLAESFMPGLIVGIIGFCCLIAGVAIAYFSVSITAGNISLLVTLIGLVGGSAAWFKWFPNSNLAKKFMGQGTPGSDPQGDVSLLNQSGKAFTRLCPSGVAIFNGRRLDVVSEGEMVEAGQSVRVIVVDGFRIVVRPE